MKRYIFVISLICFALLSCGTTKVEEQPKEINSYEVYGPAFEDWRYKFFGQELPVWFLYAYEEDLQGVLNAREDLAGITSEQLVIVQGKAVNGDQAEQFIAQQVEENQGKVVDSFWAKISEETESTESYRWLILLKQGE